VIFFELGIDLAHLCSGTRRLHFLVQDIQDAGQLTRGHFGSLGRPLFVLPLACQFPVLPVLYAVQLLAALPARENNFGALELILKTEARSFLDGTSNVRVMVARELALFRQEGQVAIERKFLAAPGALMVQRRLLLRSRRGAIKTLDSWGRIVRLHAQTAAGGHGWRQTIVAGPGWTRLTARGAQRSASPNKKTSNIRHDVYAVARRD